MDFIKHPDAYNQTLEWEKWRYTAESGQDFINRYLKQFSAREEALSFLRRKDMTYCPAYAKGALNDVKNAIYQRMADIIREGGPESYMTAVRRNVTRKGQDMNSFIGYSVLPELLVMGRVGIFVDREPLPSFATKKDAAANPPYLYIYPVEKILNWAYEKDELVSVMLEDTVPIYDEDTLLPVGEKTSQRLLNKTENGVRVRIFSGGKEAEQDYMLDIDKVPFVIFDIKQSLLTDIANYQIALMNLASSDLNYCFVANFPFLTVNTNPIEDYGMGQANVSSVSYENGLTEGPDGAVNITPVSTTIQNMDDVKTKVSPSMGMKYGIGLERPGFISPPTDPLVASMKKQAEMKDEIKQLLNLSLSSMGDSKSKEEGLSFIGQELERGEREIAAVWGQYEKSNLQAVIKYPNNYSLRTDGERFVEAEMLSAIAPSLPSRTAKRELTKSITRLLLENKVSPETMRTILVEIDKVENVVTDPNVLAMDYSNGVVSEELYSKLRGYPEGEVAKARIDHAERAARIVLAQTSASMQNPAARGVPDVSVDSSEPTTEKTLSQDAAMSRTAERMVRGEGK
jgi:hypothetical protein